MKQKKLVLTGLTVGVVGFSAAFVGCKNTTTAKTPVEGPETGTYYFDDEYGVNTLTLSGGQNFTFDYRNELLSGKYKLKDGSITLDFAKKGEEDVVGTLDETVLTFTYNGASVRFLKNVSYKVTFHSNGGSEVAAKNVTNGKTLQKPADPTKDGSKFIGWYKDAECKGLPFSFETETITANTDLYALFVDVGEADNEFKVDFDLGYEATAPETMTTVAGKLYNVAEPTRAGYDFKGWWVSSYNDGEKLTAKYTADTVFNADTTLFAVWQQTGATAPLLSVNQNGVTWEGVTSAATVTVTDPNGKKTTETVGTTAGNAFGYDFSSKAAGDYVITLTVGDKTVTAYYLNNALARVSDLRVVGNAVLMWNPVAGAEKYLVSVECGNEYHEHTDINNGTSTNFNFVNCAMKEGGIKFTVKAVANGKATSVAEFTYDRTLAAPANLKYNAESGMLTWNAVREAADYVLTIGENTYNLGNKTEFSLKGYTGDLEVSLVCKTDGYNTSAAATLALTKETPVSPANLAVNGDNLTWDAVEGATGYVVRIGQNETEVADTTFDLANKLFELNGGYQPTFGAKYTLSVKAVFENGESLYSDDLDVRYYEMFDDVDYEKGVLSWGYVVGATEYQVKVNGTTYTTDENEFAVTLTKAGENVIEVTYKDATGAVGENAVTYTVNAYKLTFDATSGASVDVEYRAVGDPMNLPETTREGFDFVGWFNSATSTSVNGKLYDDEYFYGNTDYVLYAGWTPKTYEATLDYNEKGEGEATTASITYTKDYHIDPPTVKSENSDQIFVGWFGTADGKGVQYTDALGNSLRPWQHTANMPLYAVYKDAFKYTAYGKGYAIAANSEFAAAAVTEVRIPAQYKGLPVLAIDENAFKGCKNLKKVYIPNSITFVGSTAFYDCVNIEEYIVYDNGETDPLYYSENHSLLYKNPISGDTELMFVPSTADGTYTVPYGVTRIGTRTFYKSNLSEIVVSASVASVSQSAFVSCRNLTKLTFAMPDEDQALVSLDFTPNAIEDCANLEVLELPARVKEIDDIAEAFCTFKKLKAINVVGTCAGQKYSSGKDKETEGMLLDAAGDEIIYCPLAKEFTEVTEDGKTLRQFTVPSSVTKIAANAFNRYASKNKTAYYNFDKLVVHSNVVSIGENAFLSNRYLKTVVFAAGRNSLKNMVIGEKAFYDCQYITEITFEEEGALNADNVFVPTKTCGVKEIGANAFYNTGITEVVLPSTLTKIGASAFEKSYSLEVVDLSHVNKDLVYGAHVFASCQKITSLTVTPNVGPMEFSSVFYNCSNLAAIDVAGNDNYESENGVLYSKNKETLLYYPEGMTGDFTVSSQTKKIGGGVFRNKANITKITIPISVIEIGENAFEGCTNLSEVVFAAPAEGETAGDLIIGDSAFYNCLALTEITLPARTKSVGASAFAVDSAKKSRAGLTEVTLNEGLATIGDSAFAYNGNLSEIVIPSTVTFVGDSAFRDAGLTSVTFAEGDETLELTLGDSIFSNCNKLTGIALREGTKNVPRQAFYYATKLESVVIPTTVTNDTNNGIRGIGYVAFDGCAALTTVTFTKGGTLPLSFAKGAFANCTSLTELNLPKRICSVGSDYDVFEYNTAITARANTSFTMGDPDTLTMVNSIAIERVNVMADDTADMDAEFASYDGVLYTADLKTVVWIPFGRTGNVEISKHATSFRDNAAYACKSLDSVTFEEGGTEAFIVKNSTSAYYANGTKQVFYGCYKLKSITFPSRLTEIGEYAFACSTLQPSAGNPFLTTVTFAEDTELTKLGSYAFKDTRITEFTVPDTLTEIGEKVFGGSKLETLNLSANTTVAMLTNLAADAANLKVVNIPENSTELASDEYGVVYDNKKTTISYVPVGFDAEEYVVPATVTTISESTFKNKASIKKVVFAAAAEGTAENHLSIGNSAFEGSGLTEIVLPKRLNSLGTNVFKSCKSLTKVEFEKGYSHATIPDGTFWLCTALTEITIPGEVTSIGKNAFNMYDSKNPLTALETVTFALCADGKTTSQLLTIDNYAFKTCYALKTLQTEQPIIDPETKEVTGVTLVEKLPDTLVNFGTSQGPFMECTSLERITIPNGVTAIWCDAFKGDTALTIVNLPASLKTVYSNAFNGCTNLSSVNFHKDSSGIILQASAFQDCRSLKSFDFSKIGDMLSNGSIFKNCTSLEKVEIGKNIAQAQGANLFDGCTSLTSVVWDPALKNGKTTLGNSAFKGCTSLKTVTLSGSLTQIPQYAFQECTSLVSVDLQNAPITLVAANAFLNCSSLTEIELGGSLTSVGNSSFKGCAALTKFDMPSGLTSIGTSAFEGATGLKSVDFSTVSNTRGVTIGGSAFKGSGIESVNLGTASGTAKSVVSLGNNAFENCTNLTSVIIPDIFASGKLGTTVFSGCTGITTVDWQSAQPIPSKYFMGCTALKNVTINDGVTAIASFAFQDCASLENITLPSALAYLGSTSASMSTTEGSNGGTFRGCSSLKNIDLPAGVTKLGPNLFRDCPNLTTVKFNSAIEKAYGSVFAGSPNVTFEIADTVTGMTADGGALYNGTTLIAYGGNASALTVKSGTTTIDERAFYNIDTLHTVNLPDSVTTIATYGFAYCTGLQSINLQNVESIGTYAFEFTALESVTLGLNNVLSSTFLGSASLASVTFTGGNVNLAMSAFKNCTSLTTINFQCDNAVIGSSAFEGCVALEQVNGSDKVTLIDTKAFLNAFQTKETELDFSNAVLASAAGSAFKNANKITSLKLKGTYKSSFTSTTAKEETTIPSSTFEGCTSLVTLTLLNKPTLLSGGANFKDCTNLDLDSIDFSAVTQIGANAFANCLNFHTISLPALVSNGIGGVKTVTASNFTGFSGCTNLRSVSLGSGLTMLPNNTFLGCTSLTEISMPGVTQIGERVFSGCTKLTSLTLTSAVTVVSAQAFDGWTSAQTINLPDFTEDGIPTTWATNWNEGCNATVVYKKA